MEVGYKQADRIVIKNEEGKVIAIITDSKIRTSSNIQVEIERPEKDFATIEDIKKLATDTLLPRHIANILKCSQYTINTLAATAPETLGFPVVKINNRVKIPKEAFIRFWEGEQQTPINVTVTCGSYTANSN